MDRKEKFFKVLDFMERHEKDKLEMLLLNVNHEWKFEKFIEKLDELYELSDYLIELIKKYKD